MVQSLKKKPARMRTAAEEDEADQDEEKAPEGEDDPAPWLAHSNRVLSYEEWVVECAHKDKNGHKFMVCHACQKALRSGNDSGLWNHHMAIDCCPAKVLNQWAKEWTIQQKKIKASRQPKGSRGSPTSKNAPQHVADADDCRAR